MIRPYQIIDNQNLVAEDQQNHSHHTLLWFHDQTCIGYVIISRLESEIYVHHIEVDHSINLEEKMELLVNDLKQTFDHEDIYFLHR